MRRFLKSPERIMPEEITKPMAPVASHEACGPPSDHEVHICTPYSFCFGGTLVYVLLCKQVMTSLYTVEPLVQ